MTSEGYDITVKEGDTNKDNIYTHIDKQFELLLLVVTYISGKMCPGRVKSPAVESCFANARTVILRSLALIPVFSHAIASAVTVKAVFLGSVLCCTMAGRPRASHRSFIMLTHRIPLVYLIMKANASGVAISAAIIKSPSFSLQDTNKEMMTKRVRRQWWSVGSVGLDMEEQERM